MGSVTAFAAEATVSTADELISAVQSGGTVKLGADIEQSVVVPAGVAVTLDPVSYTHLGAVRLAVLEPLFTQGKSAVFL